MRALASAFHGVGPAVAAGGWCAPCAAAWAPTIGFLGAWRAVAGSRFRLQAQCAAIPRLRRPHTCRCGLRSRDRSVAAVGGDRSPDRAGRPVSSPGVSKMPLRRYQRAASGPGGVHLAVGPPSAEERPSPQRLPPLPFFPASTVCSAAHLAGLCASGVLANAVLRQRRPAPRGVSPATDHGVHAVSAPAAMPAVVDPLGTLVSLSADPQGSPAGRPRSQMLPRSCPTLRSFVPRQQLSRPSPVGAALSPLQTAA